MSLKKSSKIKSIIVTGSKKERRKAFRKRTRLRSGKLAALDNRFISDCLIFDRTPLGVRVRLARNTRLPEHVKFFDDELQSLHVARVVWRRDNEAGLAFARERPARAARERAMFRGKYYALRRF